MKLNKLMQINYGWMFLLLFFLSLAFGSCRFFQSNTWVSHFNDATVRQWPNSSRFEVVVFTIGQFKSDAAEFLAGEPVEIDLFFVVADTALFSKMKQVFQDWPMSVTVKGTEEVSSAQRDVSLGIRSLSIDSSFINEGSLQLVNIDTTARRIALSGSVIFTRTVGTLRFGDPLQLLVEQYQIRLPELPIAPRYVQIQLDVSKRAELLTFVAIAMGFLSLFFGLSARRQKKS